MQRYNGNHRGPRGLAPWQGWTRVYKPGVPGSQEGRGYLPLRT